MSYLYQTSHSNSYILLRGQKEVMRGTEEQVWRYIHNNHSYSVGHALEYEGYAIYPIEQTQKHNVNKNSH